MEKQSKIVLANAFSLNMLRESSLGLCIDKIGHPEGFILSGYLADNIIGHADTDRVVRAFLEEGGVVGIPKGQRKTFELEDDTALLVAQYSGPRLPEGATSLPKDAKLEWFVVRKCECK